MKSNIVKSFKSFKSFKFGFRSALVLLTVCLAVFSGNAALSAKRQRFSGSVKLTVPAITSLHKGVQSLPGPTTPVPDLDENMNQCAGTMQHYRLPPSGYTPPPQTDASRAGKALYVSHNCASCHEAENSGGTLGPPLDGIGGARGEQFITAHLLNPEKQMLEFPLLFGGRSNIMPHPDLSLNEAKSVTAYLLSLPEPENGFLVSAHPKLSVPTKKSQPKHVATAAGAESIASGRALFLSRGCAACHTVDSAPSRFGPRLDGVSSRLSRLDMEEALRGGNDEPEMIRTLHLSNGEVQNIVDFLSSLPGGKPGKKAATHSGGSKQKGSH